MTEQSGFLNTVEREARTEADRVISELNRLKFDASQVIHVLNALKLEVPKELRELSPIEQIPKVNPTQDELPTEVEKMATQLMKDNPLLGEKPKPDYSKRDEKKKLEAEKRYIQNRTDVITVLTKSPMLRTHLDAKLGWPDGRMTVTLTRMKKEGKIDRRTVGFQGPSEWFLTERPVSLETLRDEVIKEKGDIPLVALVEKLGFSQLHHLTKMMDELLMQGILQKVGTANYRNPKVDTHKHRDTRTKDERANRIFIGNGRSVAGTGRSAKLSSNKEVRQILDKAEKMGAQIKKQGNAHIEVTYRGEKKILSSTPGDSNRSNREKLQQLGLNV